MTSAAPGVPPAVSAEPAAFPGLPPDTPLAVARRLVSRVITLCWVELRKIRHDRTELYTRAIQPALWLLIFAVLMRWMAQDGLSRWSRWAAVVIVISSSLFMLPAVEYRVDVVLG